MTSEPHPASEELVEIRIIGLPLLERQLASEHFDDLQREFSPLDADNESVPTRLIALREELQGRFAAFSAGPSADIAAATDRGDTSTDLVYVLPRAASEATLQLARLLDEADEYCAQGEYLLTLTTPEQALRFRRWFLSEFIRQFRGEAPIPWSDYSG